MGKTKIFQSSGDETVVCLWQVTQDCGAGGPCSDKDLVREDMHRQWQSVLNALENG